MASDYGDLRGDASWAKRLFFSFYFRTFRSALKEDDVAWGKINAQYHFDDYCRCCLVLHNAWLSVRPQLLPKFRQQGQQLMPRPLRLLYDFFENDLTTVLYYIPSIKLDPVTMMENISRTQRVAALWHTTGYAKDLLQYLYDIRRMTKERQLVIYENGSCMVGVKVEYIHQRLANTQTSHTIATVDTINRQHANMHDLDRGTTLLNLTLDIDDRTKQTYHLPDTVGCDAIIKAMADHIRVVVDRAETATSEHATKLNKDGKEVVDSSHLDPSFDIKVPVHMMLDEREAKKTIDDLQKANSLESFLFEKDMHTEESAGRPDRAPVSQMKIDAINDALRRCDITPPPRSRVAARRRLLAAHLLLAYLNSLTPSDERDPELGCVCDYIKRAGRGDFSFIGNVGVFANFSALDGSDDDDDDE